MKRVNGRHDPREALLRRRYIPCQLVRQITRIVHCEVGRVWVVSAVPPRAVQRERIGRVCARAAPPRPRKTVRGKSRKKIATTRRLRQAVLHADPCGVCQPLAARTDH